MPRMFLPPGPIKQADLFRIDLRADQPRGRFGDVFGRGREIVESIDRRISIRASRDWASVARMISSLMPSIFRSSWMPVMPFCVPAILKSMSPKWSSSPMMSVSSVHLSPSFTRPIEMPATGLVIGTPAAIRPSVAAADAGHRARAVRLEDVGDHADRVGELVVIGQHRVDAPLGEHAVADFAPARAADRPHFADRERREVVVEHELLRVLLEQAVDALLVAAGAERDGHERLRLAALEQRRAVHAREHVDLALEIARSVLLSRPSGRVPAEDQIADDVLFQVVPGDAESIGVGDALGLRIGNQFRERLGLQLAHRFGPGLLAFGLLGTLELVVEPLAQAARPARRRAAGRSPASCVPTLSISSCCKSQSSRISRWPSSSASAMRSSGISRAKPSIISTASRVPETIRSSSLVFELIVRRERDELAVDQAQPHRAERPLERQRRNAQCRGGAVHRQHVAVGLAIAGQHEALDLHFVVVAGREQRTDRAVDEPRGERFLGRGPAFALEEAAGELAGRGVSLAIVAGEREIIEPGPRRAGGDRAERDGLAILHRNRPGCLLGQ